MTDTQLYLSIVIVPNSSTGLSAMCYILTTLLPKMLVLPSSCPHTNSSPALTYQMIQFGVENLSPALYK